MSRYLRALVVTSKLLRCSPRAKTFDGLLTSVSRTLKLLRCSARAETFEGFLAKYIGVALAGLRKLNDTLGDNVVGLIVCICKPERDPSHLECDSHDALNLSVEFRVVVYELRDLHDRLTQ